MKTYDRSLVDSFEITSLILGHSSVLISKQYLLLVQCGVIARMFILNKSV